MICDIQDCDKPAEWCVAVLLFPPKPFVGQPARREYPHKLCTAHAQAVTVRDFVTDSEWQNIEHVYRSRGKKLPARERCQISFKKVKLKDVETAVLMPLRDRGEDAQNLFKKESGRYLREVDDGPT